MLPEVVPCLPVVALCYLEWRPVGTVKRNLPAQELRHGARIRSRHRRTSLEGSVPPARQLMDARGSDVQPVYWAEDLRRRTAGGERRDRLRALPRPDRLQAVRQHRRRSVERPAAGPEFIWSGLVEADAR